MNQEWGTICADGFTDEDAANACDKAGKNGDGQSYMHVVMETIMLENTATVEPL